MLIDEVMKKVFELNANNLAINPSLILRLIYGSGLHLESHPAQIYGLQAQTLQGKFSSTPTTEPVPSPEELIKADSQFSLFGFPVKLDEGLPKSVIQLRNTNGELLNAFSLNRDKKKNGPGSCKGCRGFSVFILLWFCM